MKAMTALGLMVLLIISGCSHEYQVDEFDPIPITAKFPGSVSLEIASPETFNFSKGFHSYEFKLKQALVKQYTQTMQACFEKFVPPDQPAQTKLIITVVDAALLPIEGVIFDFRLFAKVEILDEKNVKQKTATIYGIGSAEEGDKALEKAVNNSIYQLIPYIEELFTE